MAESKPSAITLAQKFVEAMLTDSHDHGFDYNLCKAMTVVSASLTPKPRAVTRLTVTLAMCNISGTLHGGAISTLFDVCTTVALATARRKGYWEMAGVTRTLSTTCLSPGFPGDEIEIEVEVAQIGKKLGNCDVWSNFEIVKEGISQVHTFSMGGVLVSARMRLAQRPNAESVNKGRSQTLDEREMFNIRRNRDSTEALIRTGSCELQQGIGGVGETPKVNGGFHDSSKRKDGKSGTEDHLNVEYEGRQWHVERDGSHSVVGDEGLES
ncbi:MAG: hypothetical protein ASARMPREDX12_001822 [Alectoria sarmentosa]|nr:MAG: hypothetical protein ASARMPREDX12_001822 [Alectoria sarmentosa]CAD6578375.1 MAG: hypothetical protein ASARMPRED_008701 [Alectoria sarmentosa]